MKAWAGGMNTELYVSSLIILQLMDANRYIILYVNIG